MKAKTYNYSKDNIVEDKKTKYTKNVIKRNVKYEDQKNCLKAAQTGNTPF